MVGSCVVSGRIVVGGAVVVVVVVVGGGGVIGVGHPGGIGRRCEQCSLDGSSSEKRLGSTTKSNPATPAIKTQATKVGNCISSGCGSSDSPTAIASPFIVFWDALFLASVSLPPLQLRPPLHLHFSFPVFR